MLEQISVSKPLISLHVFQMEMFNLENKISFKKIKLSSRKCNCSAFTCFFHFSSFLFYSKLILSSPPLVQQVEPSSHCRRVALRLADSQVPSAILCEPFDAIGKAEDLDFPPKRMEN